MKKKQHMKKLKINRETLRTLDKPQGVFGAATSVAPCGTHALACNPTQVGIRCTDTGTYDTCGATNDLCSGTCTTGGTACTGLTCDATCNGC